jgi:hypothetical protein
MDEERARARRRALRAAAALTLGLAAAPLTGCEAATDAYCRVFENTQTCCDRAPGRHWEESTHRCITLPPPLGPLVPPA